MQKLWEGPSVVEYVEKKLRFKTKIKRNTKYFITQSWKPYKQSCNAGANILDSWGVCFALPQKLLENCFWKNDCVIFHCVDNVSSDTLSRAASAVLCKL